MNGAESRKKWKMLYHQSMNYAAASDTRVDLHEEKLHLKSRYHIFCESKRPLQLPDAGISFHERKNL